MKANIPKCLSEKQKLEVKAYVEAEAQYRFEQIKHKLHDIDIMLALTALRRQGYGYKRLQAFTDEFMAVAGEYGATYDEAMYNALRVHMKLSGIELEGVV